MFVCNDNISARQTRVSHLESAHKPLKKPAPRLNSAAQILHQTTMNTETGAVCHARHKNPTICLRAKSVFVCECVEHSLI